MHVGIVGGLSRTARLWERAAMDLGHSIECHDGRTNARGTESLEALVERSDFVVVITDVNSHGGVQITRKLAVQRGRPHVLVRRLRPAKLAELIATRGAP